LQWKFSGMSGGGVFVPGYGGKSQIEFFENKIELRSVLSDT
jgi:hypothetical protein